MSDAERQVIKPQKKEKKWRVERKPVLKGVPMGKAISERRIPVEETDLTIVATKYKIDETETRD